MGYKVILSTLALEDLEQIVATSPRTIPLLPNGSAIGCSTRPRPSVICLTAAAMCGSGPA
jgi:hypothetical protein